MQKTNQFDTTKFFKNYANFSGRSTRTDFWLFQAIVLLIGIGIFGLSFIGGTSGVVYSLFTILQFIFGLFIIIPNFAISMRRLYDTGRLGWWMLPGVIPGPYFLYLVQLYYFHGYTQQRH